MTSAHGDKPTRTRRFLPIIISAVLAIALNTALSTFTEIGLFGRIFAAAAVFVTVSLIAEAISRSISKRRTIRPSAEDPGSSHI